MAFPTIPTVAAGRVLWSTNLSPAGTHTFPNLSSLTKDAGDLLIAIIIQYDGNSTNAEYSAWGGSFTEFGDFAGTATMAIGAAYKWSTGSEAGTFTVTSADTSTNDSVCVLLSIPGAHPSTPPEAGSFATGTAPDSASFNPAGWGTEDTLWIAVGGSGEDSTAGAYTGISTAPTNYGNQSDSGITADVVGGVEGGVAFRQLNAASEDPGTWSMDTSNARGASLIIAVRPNLTQSITPGLIDASSAIYAPTLLNINAILLDVIDASSAIYAPTLAQAAPTIAPPLIDAGSAIYAPTLVGKNTLTLGLIDSTSAIYAPTVYRYYPLTPPLIDAGSAIYAPTLVGKNALTVGLIDAGSAIYAPVLTPSTTVALGLIDAGSALYAPVLAAKSTLSVGLIDAGSAIYAPTLAAKNTLLLGLIDSGSAVYAPVVVASGGTLDLVLDTLGAGPSIYAPVVEYLTLEQIRINRAFAGVLYLEYFGRRGNAQRDHRVL